MWLTRAAIERPIAVLMLVLSFVVLGYVSMGRLPVDLYPKIDFPMVTVTTVYPGAGPEEIESTVTKPIEDAVSGVNGVKQVTSTSQEGVSSAMVEFYLGTELNMAAGDVRERIDAIRGVLPRDADDPVLLKLDIAALPVISMGLSGKRPSTQLRLLADDIIKDRLGKLPGVASVSVAGGDVREILVAVDGNRLRAYGLTIDQINQLLVAENLNVPAGTVEEGRREYAIRLVGEFDSPEQIRQLKIPNPVGPPIRLSDIATVSDTTAERRVFTRLDRQDSIAITVQKQSNANTVGICDAVRAELEAMRKVLPKDLRFKVAYDQSKFIKDTLSDVTFSLFLGIILVTLVVFLFLHSVRGTAIVALAIPTSIIATFSVMYFGGFTLNMMTMMALSLVVGILVDDSIVVLENIHRHLRLGETPAQAAFNGRTEIGLAAITITFVDVVVFLPIAYSGGIVGMFFRQFGLTIATATLFSLFVSFTLTPMLCSRWLKSIRRSEGELAPQVDDDAPRLPTPGEGGVLARLSARFDAFYDGLDRRYRRVLGWALGHRWAVILSGVAAVIVMSTSASRLGFEMFPGVDQGQFQIDVEMPAGTSLSETDRVATKLEDFVWDRHRFPGELKSTFSTVGSTASGLVGASGQGAVYASIMVVLVDKTERHRSDRQIMTQVEQFARGIPGADITTTAASSMGRHESPLQIELTGQDTNELLRVAEEVKSRVATVKGTREVDVSWKVGKPEVHAHVDRARAAEYRLTSGSLAAGSVAGALRTSIQGSTDTKYRESGKEYNIRVRLRESVPERERQRHPEVWKGDVTEPLDVERVSNIVVANGPGGPIRLGDVAQVAMETGPTKIDRRDRQRMIKVTGDLRVGYALGNVVGEIRRALTPVRFGNVNVNYGGEAQMMGESFGYLGQALQLSIILVFMLMAALFESFLSPLIIMISLPMAAVGAFVALVITGNTMSMVAMIGMIMLMGLVTKNAILLVDYTNTLRGRGLPREEAILQAGPTRLRPILMTTTAMICGMLPTALALGRGSEIRAPMAIAVVGGLIVSTLLTLVMVPVVYTYFDNLAMRLHRVKERLL